MSDSVLIRLAVPADALTIAGVHIRSWQWAYRGQIPDEFLDRLSEGLERRVAFWREHVSNPPTSSRTWVAEQNGSVVGFADTGTSRDDDAGPDTGEVKAIYLDPSVAGTGVGRALFAHAVDDLRQRGFRSATLWVLATNQRARRFYEAAGWRPDGATKTEQRPGLALNEARYRMTFAAEPTPPMRD